MPPKKATTGAKFSSENQPVALAASEAPASEVGMKRYSRTTDEINEENLNEAVGTEAKVGALIVLAKKRTTDVAELEQGERSRVPSSDISKQKGDKAKRKKEKGKQRTVSLSKYADEVLAADWSLIYTRRESLQRFGSQQYSNGEKKMAVMLMLDDMLLAHPEVDIDLIGGGAIPSCDSIAAKACASLCISKPMLRSWLEEYIATGAFEESVREKPVQKISNMQQLSVFHILEMHAYFTEKQREGNVTSFASIASHLNSVSRLGDMSTLDNCPRTQVSADVVREACNTYLDYGWSKVKRVGKTELTEEKAIARSYRKNVGWAELAEAVRKERCGLALNLYMDESYVHKDHSSDFSVCATDANGNVIKDLKASKGKGERICMIGGITRWGHFTTRRIKFEGVPVVDALGQPKFAESGKRVWVGKIVEGGGDGSIVVDCEFVNARGEEVEKGGAFIELKNNGAPRKLFEKPPKKSFNSSTNATDLKSLADDWGVRYVVNGKVLSRKNLMPLMRAELIIRTAAAAPAIDAAATAAAGASPATAAAAGKSDFFQPGNNTVYIDLLL
jgi:hypothetical protein